MWRRRRENDRPSLTIQDGSGSVLRNRRVRQQSADASSEVKIYRTGHSFTPL